MRILLLEVQTSKAVQFYQLILSHTYESACIKDRQIIRKGELPLTYY